MEWFKSNTQIDFMGARRWTACISIFIFIFSIVGLGFKGLNWGLDFTGGTQIEVTYASAANLDDIREQLFSLGYKDAQVVKYGSSNDVLISIAPKKRDQDQMGMVNAILQALPGATKQRVDYVGPQVGEELATKGLLAVVVALIATMIYIAFRFEYRLAVSSAVALIHDPILILGIFSWMNIPFDLKALAGVLAVIGYSLNDTIVVFDRVRENFIKVRRMDTLEIMNLSINQTLSRTIMTSALTLCVVVALFLYGGESIHGFSLALMIGILIGTYSSIYIAGALAVSIGLDRKDFLPKKKIHEDEVY